AAWGAPPWLRRSGVCLTSGTVFGMRSGAGGGCRRLPGSPARAAAEGHTISTTATTIAIIARTITSTGQLRQTDAVGSAVWLRVVGRGGRTGWTSCAVAIAAATGACDGACAGACADACADACAG